MAGKDSKNIKVEVEDNKTVDEDESVNHPFQEQIKKTQFCRYFTSGKCTKGRACGFAHSTRELRKVPDLTKTSFCKLYKKGECTKSREECPFAHGVHDLRMTPMFQANRADKTCKSKPKSTPVKARVSQLNDPPGTPHYCGSELASGAAYLATSLPDVGFKQERAREEAHTNHSDHKATMHTGLEYLESLVGDTAANHAKELEGAVGRSQDLHAAVQACAQKERHASMEEPLTSKTAVAWNDSSIADSDMVASRRTYPHVATQEHDNMYQRPVPGQWGYGICVMPSRMPMEMRLPPDASMRLFGARENTSGEIARVPFDTINLVQLPPADCQSLERFLKGAAPEYYDD